MRVTWIVLFVLLAICAHLPTGARPVHAQSSTLSKRAAYCQRIVGSAGRRFKRAELYAWRTCLDHILEGKTCDAVKRDSAIVRAKTRFVTAVARACKPYKAVDVAFASPPGGVGFAKSCDFEAGSRETAESSCGALQVTDATSLTQCLTCWKEDEVHELLQILYPRRQGKCPPVRNSTAGPRRPPVQPASRPSSARAPSPEPGAHSSSRRIGRRSGASTAFARVRCPDLVPTRRRNMPCSPHRRSATGRCGPVRRLPPGGTCVPRTRCRRATRPSTRWRTSRRA